MSATQGPSEQEQTEQKAKLTAFGKRLETDSALAAKFKADKDGTLRSEGISDAAINALQAHAAAKRGDDVSGYYYYYWVEPEYYTWYYVY